MAAEVTAAPSPATDSGRETGAALRGSAVFLLGRVAAGGVGLLTQVIVVRMLTKHDYGLLAYALAAAALVQAVLPLGLDRADTRFFARFDERGDRGRVVGTAITEALVVVSTGTVVVAGAALLGRGWAAGHGGAVVLLILAIAPLAALDSGVLNVFAVLSRPSAIFLRRYVLDPGLRLLAVGVVAVGGATVTGLAVAYLVAALLGTTLYLALVARLLRRYWLTPAATRTPVSWPGWPLMRFAVPMLAAALMFAATTSVPVVLLERLGSLADVAELRAVQPLAALVLMVPTVFGTLFVPRAARLLARQEPAQLNEHYWRTTVWVGTLAFPAVVVMVAFSHEITEALFGQRYVGAAPALGLMAAAFYVNACFGLNGSLLQMAGELRAVMVANVVGMLLAVGLSVLLVPPLGMMGAAVAVAAAVVVPQPIKQAALARAGVRGTDPMALRLWGSAAALLLGSWLVGLAVDGVGVALPVAAAAGAALALALRHDLHLEDAFPAAAPVLNRWRARLPRRRPAAAPPAVAGQPGSLQCLDWRFLLPDPHLGRVLVVGGLVRELAALRSQGADVVHVEQLPRASGRFDTVLAAGADADVEAALAVLAARGVLVLTVTAGPPGRLRPLPWLPWSRWQRHLRRHGLEVVAQACALPSLRATSALVDVRSTAALRRALLTLPAGRRGRWAGRAVAVAVAVGLRQALCREGVLLATRPPVAR